LTISRKESHIPIVSVIVTTYNRQEYLAETIGSILSQSYRDLELIIVDNCSNYDFFQFLSTFQDDRIRGYVNDNKGIIAVNRNFGIEKSLGEFLAFCDDDDVWMGNKLEKQLEVIQSNRLHSEVLIYTDALLVHDNYRDTIRRCSEIKSKGRILRSNPIVFSSVLVSNTKDVFFNEMLPVKGSEDCELWLRLYSKGYQFNRLGYLLTKHRLSSNSVSAIHRPSNYLRLCLIYIFQLLDNRISVDRSWKVVFNLFFLVFMFLISSLKLAISKSYIKLWRAI
jgi:glycosyltransferase involved in cell wall biosynthesis